jgi:hypothetical protein
MRFITEFVFIDDLSGKLYLNGIDIDLHDHLTDDADWDAEYWDFDSE